MTYKLTTYKTLIGTKEILEIPNKDFQWVIYQDNKAKYHVDCFDLQTESNVLMNSFVLCEKRTIDSVIKEIATRNNVNLSVKKPPLIEIEVKSELKELDLEPLPLEWLN